jgi:Fe-S cluster assembly protein SufD
MNTIENIQERFVELQSNNQDGQLATLRQNAFEAFNRMGVPTSKHEEWKYTRIGGLFNKEFDIARHVSLTSDDIAEFRLPGYQNANELVFINGAYTPALSVVRSKELEVLPLQDAAADERFSAIISKNLGQSGRYVKDGIHALNTAFMQEGVFVHVRKGKTTEHPVYIYNITDARSVNILSQPRSLFHIAENAEVQIVETYATLGLCESFTNQVMEAVVERDARVEYYKIQNDAAHTHQVSTTLFRQVSKSFVHAVTITLNGGIVRNNLNFGMAADNSESHMYGLYFLKGKTHADNHTVVDNIQPNCLSNELYKGIIDDQATAVFNGKIFVQPLAQKTNAFQSNKNILLSDAATVNTKPQLEIFADDVKCSHGCTVGRLDEEGMFYLRSRGISEQTARALLVHAFAVDILEHIKPEPIRAYVDQLIEERLQL